MMLFDGGGEEAAQPDAVAAHDGRLLLAVIVQEVGSDNLAVDRAQFEDVANLYASFSGEFGIAFDAGLALLDKGNVGDDIGLEVARVVHVLQMLVAHHQFLVEWV